MLHTLFHCSSCCCGWGIALGPKTHSICRQKQKWQQKKKNRNKKRTNSAVNKLQSAKGKKQRRVSTRLTLANEYPFLCLFSACPRSPLLFCPPCDHFIKFIQRCDHAFYHAKYPVAFAGVEFLVYFFGCT